MFIKALLIVISDTFHNNNRLRISDNEYGSILYVLGFVSVYIIESLSIFLRVMGFHLTFAMLELWWKGVCVNFIFECISYKSWKKITVLNVMYANCEEWYFDSCIWWILMQVSVALFMSVYNSTTYSMMKNGYCCSIIWWAY